MAHVIDNLGGNTASVELRGWQRWPTWIGYATSLWCLVYGALGLYWTLGGAGFPFGENDPNAAMISLLAGVRTEVGAPLIAALGLAGAVGSLAMAQSRGGRLIRGVLLVGAWGVAATLLLVVPDFRVLMAVAYALLLQFNLLDWPTVNQMMCVVGGLLWGATAVTYRRRTQNACAYCGRTDASASWTTPAAAARWGNWATIVAVIIPVFYAATRWAWALDIPLGITEEFLRQGQATGLWWRGAGLATVAVGGAILTLGLVQRWGEVFPRWMVGLAGKPVPLSLGIIPASLASVIVTSAGLMFIRIQLLGVTREIFGEGNWAATAPMLLWPLWGVALGAATLAYYYRRRGRCRHCGRL